MDVIFLLILWWYMTGTHIWPAISDSPVYVCLNLQQTVYKLKRSDKWPDEVFCARKFKQNASLCLIVKTAQVNKLVETRLIHIESTTWDLGTNTHELKVMSQGNAIRKLEKYLLFYWFSGVAGFVFLSHS